MRGDPITQLHDILALFPANHASPARFFPVVLAHLRDLFPASDPVLLLYPRRNHRSRQHYYPPGAPHPETQPDRLGPEYGDFAAGSPLVHQDTLYLPVPPSEKPQGFLALCIPPPEPQTLILLNTLTQLLAGELRRQEALAITTEQRLLSALDRTLAKATDIDELLAAAAQLLLRYHKGFCVVTRRLHDSTLLSPPQVYSAAATTDFQAQCLALEQRLALAVVSTAKGSARQLEPAPSRRGQSWLQVVFPLVRDKETYGCLTLFSRLTPDSSPLLLRQQLSRISSTLAEGLERLTLASRLGALTHDYASRSEESSTLFRISRALHVIPRMNELIHFILAAATSSDGGGFDRAMVFLANKKSDMLQGMLGLTRETGELTLPPALGSQAWEKPRLSIEVQTQQRQAPFCRAVMKQRLALESDNPIARAFLRNRIVLVSYPGGESADALVLADELALGPYACAPLAGGNRVLGVLVVANTRTQTDIPADRLRFLEIFSNLAGAALENALLVRQLENAYQDLQAAQDRLLHGERLALLGEMAATVAHELKTPLVSIGGFAHRLARGVQSPEQREYAGIIVREIERMEGLLKGVLTFSKKHLLCFGLCDLNQLIEKAVQLEELPCSESGIVIKCHLAPDLPPIHGDADKLTQVLLNFLSNARQAMPTGGILSIRSRSGLLVGKKCVTIEVEDSGGGIPPHLLSQLFNPFFSTKEEGTGLGLAISAKIVEQHRGEIEVFNRGQGAVFIVHLPLE